MQQRAKDSSKLAAAATLYAAFAVYLYQPYFKSFSQWEWLLPINVCLGSLGCYILSRRWVAKFAALLFGGALYGFGPFLLSLMKFHPTAGLLAAAVPWLFCPAAYTGKKGWRWTSILLVAVPFVAILLFFRISAEYRFFAVPIRAKLRTDDLAALMAPLVMVKLGSIVLISFYHVPVSALSIGLVMMLKARRWGIMAIVVLAVALVLSRSLLPREQFVWLGVSPIIWLSIPLLIGSVLTALGMQGLSSAGYSDRKWILMAAAVMAVLAILNLLLATKYFQVFFGLASGYARLFTLAGKIHIMGAIAVAVMFFMVRARLRLHWLRWMILCCAIGVDLFFSARFIVDKIL